MKRLIFTLIISSCFAHAESTEFEPISNSLYETPNSSTDGDLIQIEKVVYDTRAKASFCRRNTDMIDTIVVHHSETRSIETPLDINAYHLSRGTKADPWYMIAYSFVLNAPYPGNSTPRARASYGRPIEYVGAHAGSNVYVPMDNFQKDLYAKEPIKCGTKNGPLAVDPDITKNGKIKANVTTIGIVTIGNYAPFSRDNPHGDAPARQGSDQVIDMYARLSCQLQKQYPRIKNISYHRQYHDTSCAGTLNQRLDDIKLKAKEYGCDFKILPQNYW